LCCVVSNQYNLIQHREYFETFVAALDKFGIKHTATVSGMGNKAIMDIEFVDRNLKFKKLNEEFTTGIRLSNSYDKTAGLGIAPRYKRLACLNGMVLSRSGMTMVCKHNSVLAKNVDDFIKTRLDHIVSQSAYLQDLISESMKDTIEWKSAVKIICKLFSQSEHREEILKRLGIAMVETKEKIIVGKKSFDAIGKDKAKVNFILDKEKAAKLDRWTIYNAITNYLSFGSISDGFEYYAQKKAERVLTTKLERMPMLEVFA
jgi:hypothetical protein